MNELVFALPDAIVIPLPAHGFFEGLLAAYYICFAFAFAKLMSNFLNEGANVEDAFMVAGCMAAFWPLTFWLLIGFFSEHECPDCDNCDDGTDEGDEQ